MFAALKPTVWTKVMEAATVPKTFVGQDACVSRWPQAERSL